MRIRKIVVTFGTISFSSYLCSRDKIFEFMTTNDFFEIVGKRICTEATKARIRRDYPPHIAEWKCTVIDLVERAEHIERLVAMMQPAGLWYNPSTSLKY